MKIFFIRHAESFKSTEDRHGGKGLPLTDQGKQDIIDLILFLENQENIIFQESLLYCSNLVQVIETAKIIEDERIVSFQISSHIKNISLGVLDGLSKEEALKKFPNEATNLELWRKGRIKIDDFSINGAETLEQFYSRIFKFIETVIRYEKDIILIGTRSVGVALANIFTKFEESIDIENYKRYLFDPCSVSKFEYRINNPRIGYINNTDFLSIKPKYPDK